MVKPPLRTKSIGTKVSDEEYTQLERAATASGRTLGEWCREVMLASAKGQPSKADPSGADQSLMAELVALRTILLNASWRRAAVLRSLRCGPSVDGSSLWIANQSTA